MALKVLLGQQGLLGRKDLLAKQAQPDLRALSVKLALLVKPARLVLKVLSAKPEPPALRDPPAACSTMQISMR